LGFNHTVDDGRLFLIAHVWFEITIFRQAGNTGIHGNLRAGALNGYVEDGVTGFNTETIIHTLVQP
jgi:hypothetical protein